MSVGTNVRTPVIPLLNLTVFVIQAQVLQICHWHIYECLNCLLSISTRHCKFKSKLLVSLRTDTQLLFSSPEHKVLKMSFCGGPLFVIHRPSVHPSTIALNNFSSETPYWILTKLHRNDPRVVPYKSCSNHYSWLHK